MKDKIQDAVLMSLRPKWAALIATEKKTVEVRKKFPGMVYLPFKIYLYCTNVNGGGLHVRVSQRRGLLNRGRIHKLSARRARLWFALEGPGNLRHPEGSVRFRDDTSASVLALCG